MVVCNHVEGVVSSPHGPFYGPLAHGFACGAHIPVHVSEPWNMLNDPARTYQEDRKALADSWGVTTPAEFAEQVNALLAGRNIGMVTDAVLHLRRQLIRDHGGYDAQTWADAAGHWARTSNLSPEQTHTVIDRTGVIARYEQRFQADGLLPPGVTVSSVFGYDFGRVVNMARWGFGAMFIDYRTAESIVLRAGELCRQRYSSWADFSAGYALGRVIRFDDEQYGHMYVSVRGPHQLLMSERHSPWWHIPFHPS